MLGTSMISVRYRLRLVKTMRLLGGRSQASMTLRGGQCTDIVVAHDVSCHIPCWSNVSNSVAQLSISTVRSCLAEVTVIFIFM